MLGVNAFDDRWYTGWESGPTASGKSVNYSTALKVSAYYACVKLISDTIGILPKHVMERMTDGTREKAENHPLYDLVHQQPNPMQTSIEFFAMMTAHVVMRNRAYAKIVPGPRGFADQVWPLHPDNVSIEHLSGGGYRYKVREGGGEKTYNDEDILHLRGFQQDSIEGLDMLPLMRESIGVASATMEYRAKFFGNDASPSGVLKKAGKLSPEGQKNLKESWMAAHRGGHSIAVLEDGLDWQSIGIDPQKAQLIQSEEFNAEDICRWLGVPPFMIGLTSKSTSWGTGIEQQNIGFVQYTLLPLVERWEQAISRDLILAPKKYYVDFVLDGLLRGDSAQRYSVYSIGRELGMFTPNDLLRLENMNPRTDPGGDAYIGDMGRSLSPAQIGQAEPEEEEPEEGAEEEVPPANESTAVLHPGDGKSGEAFVKFTEAKTAFDVRIDPAANVFLIDAAARVVRKEIAATTKAAKKFKGSEWAVEVHKFYSDHPPFVSEMLHISLGAALGYCGDQEHELAMNGPACMTDWETRRVKDLVALALEAR